MMHLIRRSLKALTVGLAALASVVTVAGAQAQEKKPNIVVIMTDDVGWGDLGSYGGGVMRGAPTPHLDRLAAEGMRFVNYYGQASCTAGRASFITGRIPIRTALSLVLVPGDPNYLRREDPTIAEQMKKAGYTTVELGKWHLGDVPDAYLIAHGFDEMYHMLPYYAGVYAYDDPNLNPAWPKNDPKFMAAWKTVNIGEWEGKAGEPAKKVRDFTYPHLATSDTEIRDTAINWIKQHARDDRPFFMYLNFMKLHQPNFPSPDWKGKSPGMHPYLDSLMELDHNSGMVVQAIRDLGLADNTLVVWTTDNGAWVDAWPDAGYTPFRGEKGTPFEGGFRVPAVAWWPGRIQAGRVATDMMSHMDWWPTFARLAGLQPPPREWQDNQGNPIIFDGIDQSDLLLGKGPGKREEFVFYNDTSFGGVRYKRWKFLFTAKETWLGPEIPLLAPAVYNLEWDPGEQYDQLFNGAAPTRGDFKLSPGRFAGPDRGWTLMYAQEVMGRHFGELKKFPNRRSAPGGGGISQLIPPENR
jgi:arylsulfatase